MTDEELGRQHGRLLIPRSRGAVSGILLVLLGAWGALIPLVGPYFDFAYTPNDPFVFTASRFWLQILPGLVTVVGGLLLVTTANRAVAVLGGYLGVVAGAWFVVGTTLLPYLPDSWGDVGTPVGSRLTQTFETLSFFNGLGVLIVFLAAHALGRVTVRSLRDVAAVEKRHQSRAEHDREGDAVGDRDARGRESVRDRDRDGYRDRGVLNDRDQTDRSSDGDLADRRVADGDRDLARPEHDRHLTDQARDRDRIGGDRDGTAREIPDGEVAGPTPRDATDRPTEGHGGSTRVTRE